MRDGLLVVDKPAGPTSHDVVARMRRVLRERRIGHTGTLDPMATGVLALVVGRATRLAQFLSNSDKSYDAVVRLGFATDTGDALGRPVESPGVPMPSRDAIDSALDAFRGTFLQQPPAFSAKKIGGKRSHALARARRSTRAGDRSGSVLEVRTDGDAPVAVSATGDGVDSVPTPSPPLPSPASVTAHAIEIIAIDDDRVTLRVDCSAGFYVRSLAHDLGERLGTGGHLAALRRTRSADVTLADAIPLEAAERDPDTAAAAIIPLGRMLTGLPAVILTVDGVTRVVHGREVGPGLGIRDSGFETPLEPRIAPFESRLFRLLDEAGSLVAIARPSSAPASLHPSVVLM